MKNQFGSWIIKTLRIFVIPILFSTFLTIEAMGYSGDATPASGVPLLNDYGQHSISYFPENVDSPTDSEPTIVIWYGLEQSFGHIGTPQDQINILGNVSDPQGVKSLTYSLNGTDKGNLLIGPDSRRLANPGDFNVEIFYDDSDLLIGANVLVITATDNGDNISEETVTVNYTDVNTWSLPYDTNWGTAISIQDEAQIVDGLWDIVSGGVRTTEPGYDRLIAIGDVDWDDYEVTVPVTIHDVLYDNSAGLGIMMRWNGHTDDPVSGWQPKSGWIPFGAVGWYRWRDDYFGDRLQIYGNEGHILAEDISGRKLVEDTTYMFKMRVESMPDEGALYMLKVWEQGGLEPPGWDFMGQADVSDPANGSFLLLAHLVDATFGDVEVDPLGTDTTDPTIRNIQVRPGLTSAIVSWETDERTTDRVYYGPTQSYSFVPVSDPNWDIRHSVLLTGLSPDSLYHFKITARDTSGNSASSSDQTFSTEVKASSSGIDSDDFHTCSLNTDLWSFVDPVGDSTVGIVGGFTDDAWLKIAVPGGTDHDLWIKRYDSPRIMQPANNADFEIEVKFESEVNAIHQLQGILVEESQPDQDYLRFGFWYDGTVNKTVIFAAGYIDGIPIVKNDQYINSATPLYMRVTRQGDTWTQKYSYDGTSWTTSRTFTHPIHVTAVGTYAGNAADLTSLASAGFRNTEVSEDYHYSSRELIETEGISAGAPAHTGYMDYFSNTASPIVAEDGERNTLMVNVNPSESGSVQAIPNKSNYSCAEEVILTAIPNSDWYFASWSGDLGGSSNPANITMEGEKEITANFTQNEFTLSVNVVGKGTVEQIPNQSSYYYGDVVKLTAVPASGWKFSSWSGDLTGHTNPSNLTIDTSKTVTAIFEKIPNIFMPLISKD